MVGCKVGADVYRAHGNREYMKRLDASMDALKEVCLDDVYDKLLRKRGVQSDSKVEVQRDLEAD